MKKITGFLFVLFLLLFLEVAVRGNLLDQVYFPTPSTVLLKLFALLTTFDEQWDNELWKHIIATLFRSVIGFLIAMLIALPIGLLMGSFRWIYVLLEPIVDMLRPMPSAAIIPVAIMLCGIENQMKIAVITFGAVWATIISTIDGIRGVDSMLLDTGKMLQLKNHQMLFTIIFPAALPTIVTGMRISLAIALILSVSSEMIAGSDGLGYFILDAERGFDFSRMYAGIVILGMIGYISSRAFALLEQRILFWHYLPRSSNIG